MDAKQRWNDQDLAERKEARIATTDDLLKRDRILACRAAKRDKQQMDHEEHKIRLQHDLAVAEALRRDTFQSEQEEKRIKANADIQLKLMKGQQQSALITEMFRCQKSQEDIKSLLALLSKSFFGSEA